LDPVAFYPDGKTLIAIEHHGEAIVFLDTTTGEHRRRLKVPGLGSEIAFSPDLKILAAPIAADFSIHLWDVAKGKELLQLPQVNSWPQRFTFSSDSNILAWARDEKSGAGVSLIDVATGKEIRRIAKGIESPNFLTYWPNDKTLAFCAGWERTVRFWDIENDREIRPPEGHRGDISSIIFSRDGKNVISSGMDGTVRQWEVASGKELHQFTGQKKGLWGMAVSPDDKMIATASLNDRIIHLWDSATGNEIRRLEGHQDGVDSLAFSPDAKILASGGSQNAGHQLLRFWDVNTGKEIRLAVDPDPVPVEPDHRGMEGILSVGRVKFSPDGKFLAAACRNNIVIFDAATGRRFAQLIPPKIMDIKDIAFSPDGRSLLSGGQGDHVGGKYSIHFWELASGKERLTIKAVGAKTYAVAFSPDGRFLAAGGTDKHIGIADMVWILDARNGEVIHKFEGHQSWMSQLAFSPDGKRLASGCQDTTILIWDVADLPSAHQPQSAKLSAGELDQLWSDLAADDAEKAYRAIWKLVAVPRQAVPLLKGRLKPAVAIDSERASRLIADLDSTSFTAREKAFEDLSRLDDFAEPGLRKKLAAKPSLETRRRIETLLGKLQGPVTSAEKLRSLRAVEVLEHIGTPEAKNLLTVLAGGAPEARLTQEAKGALMRLQTKEPRTK